VQKTLNDLGYDCGSEDGVMGPNTRSCIRSFQEANDLEVTGKVNEATYQMMLVKR
jgi:peptidoglycan hydrolase-like protein with peptidoglycan-binding domain